MIDRILGLGVVGLAIWYGLTAGGYEAGFGDPLGPAAFPQALAVAAGILGLGVALRPGPAPARPAAATAARQLATLGVLVAYALLLEPLGFPLATFLGTAALAALIGTTWPKALLAGAVTSPLLYVVFDTFLGIPLPFAPDL